MTEDSYGASFSGIARTDRRIGTHFFVAAMTFLLHRALEKKLKAPGLDLSVKKALQAFTRPRWPSSL